MVCLFLSYKQRPSVSARASTVYNRAYAILGSSDTWLNGWRDASWQLVTSRSTDPSKECRAKFCGPRFTERPVWRAPDPPTAEDSRPATLLTAQSAGELLSHRHQTADDPRPQQPSFGRNGISADDRVVRHLLVSEQRSRRADRQPTYSSINPAPTIASSSYESRQLAQPESYTITVIASVMACYSPSERSGVGHGSSLAIRYPQCIDRKRSNPHFSGHFVQASGATSPRRRPRYGPRFSGYCAQIPDFCGHYFSLAGTVVAAMTARPA